MATGNQTRAVPTAGRSDRKIISTAHNTGAWISRNQCVDVLLQKQGYQWTNFKYSSSTQFPVAEIGSTGYILPSKNRIKTINNTNPIPPLG